MSFAMDNICSMCQAGVPHDCSGRTGKRPKSKEKKMKCQSCGFRTVHVFDNGLNRFICSECEME